MKITVSNCDFHDAFRAYDRMENFSYEGRNLLFDFFEEVEQEIGEEMELDVIAICCYFYEDTPDNIAQNYDIDLSDCEDNDDRQEAIIEYLNNNTMVVGGTPQGTIIYQAF